jgi:hypothetical protein
VNESLSSKELANVASEGLESHFAFVVGLITTIILGLLPIIRVRSWQGIILLIRILAKFWSTWSTWSTQFITFKSFSRLLTAIRVFTFQKDQGSD